MSYISMYIASIVVHVIRISPIISIEKVKKQYIFHTCVEDL